MVCVCVSVWMNDLFLGSLSPSLLPPTSSFSLSLSLSLYLPPLPSPSAPGVMAARGILENPAMFAGHPSTPLSWPAGLGGHCPHPWPLAHPLPPTPHPHAGEAHDSRGKEDVQHSTQHPGRFGLPQNTLWYHLTHQHISIFSIYLSENVANGVITFYYSHVQFFYKCYIIYVNVAGPLRSLEERVWSLGHEL